MKARHASFAALLAALVGCVPYGPGYGPGYTGAGDLTCRQIAQCVDDEGYAALDSCVSRGLPSEAALYVELDDCYLACGDDERCLNQCLPLVAACICGDGYMIDDRTGDCVDVRHVQWLVAVVQADVTGFCGLDGVGADEFFHVVKLDSVAAHVSGHSDCFQDRYAQWPASSTWPYSIGQVFAFDLLEADVLFDDTYIRDMAYNGSGNPVPLPELELAVAASTGTLFQTSALHFFVDHR